MIATILAEAATGAAPEAPAQKPAGGGLDGMLVLMVLMGVFMYFMVIRPQRRQEKARREMLSKIQKNDHVITSSGLHGIVSSVNGEEVVLKVDESKDVKMRFSRSAIAQVMAEEPKDGQ